MKQFTILLALTLVACQTQEYIINDDSCDIKENTSEAVITKSSVATSSTSRIVFLPETDQKAWVAMGHIEDRFKACDISESILETMTTESLVESVLYYPLNFLVLAYNDPVYAVELIVKNSALHRELLKRADGTELMIARFVKTRPTRKMERREEDLADEIPFQDEMFMDYFIGSGQLPDIMTFKNQLKLRDGLEQKVEDMLSQPKRYSTLSMAAMSYINTAFDYRLPVFESPTRSYYYIGTTYLSTPFGKSIEADLYSEASDDEIAGMNSYVATNFPNAIIRGNASTRYNCHSYAWHQNDTNNIYWIESMDSSSMQDQISKYYTDDLYVSTTFSNATRARYVSADHSAVILTSGKFLSKWGQLSLVEHDYDYGPYNSSSINYYRVQNLPKIDYTSSVSGPTVVSPNTQNTYTITHPAATDTTYSVRCEYLVTNNPNAFSFTQTNATSYALTCYDYGAYKIYVEGYRGNYLYSVKEYLVVCVGNRTRQRIEDEDITDLEAFIWDNLDLISE